MKRVLFVLVLALSTVFLLGCSKVRLLPGAPVQDGFESPSLSNLWETDKIIAADAVLQSRVVRSGHGALQITLHTSDVFEAGRNGDPPSERAELTEAEGLISQQGKRYSFSFSMLIPNDFPLVGKRLIIAQWKQECPRGHSCDDNAPVLAVRYVSGVLSISQTIGAHRVTLWRSSEDPRNKWLDFRFHVCFSPDSNGSIVGHLNDSLVVNYSGPTTYQENQTTGYPTPSRFYFKMGLYRDTMAEPMTIFIDDYRKELLSENQKRSQY
jgi:hypothetical protein